MAFVLLKFGKLGPADYGFRPLRSAEARWHLLRLAGFVTAVYWLAYEPVKALADQFFFESAANALFVDALPEAQPLRILLVFYACLTAALVEEPVFRSIPWLYFSRVCSSPVLPYVATTSVLFAAIH